MQLKNTKLPNTSKMYKITKKVFPVKTFTHDVKIDYDVPLEYRSEMIRSSWQFIWGKSTQIEHVVDNTEYIKTKIPVDAINLFKHIIVTNTPTIAFGWLVPTYMTFDIPQKITHRKTYISVIPLDEYNKEDHVTYLVHQENV